LKTFTLNFVIAKHKSPAHTRLIPTVGLLLLLAWQK